MRQWGNARVSVSIGAMNTTAQPTTDSRRHAKFLYWTGWRITDIADYLDEKEKTVHSWKARDEWDRADNVERIGGALEARLVQLILKDGKSAGDFKEIDLLHRQLERQARIQRFQGGGTETELNPNIAPAFGRFLTASSRASSQLWRSIDVVTRLPAWVTPQQSALEDVMMCLRRLGQVGSCDCYRVTLGPACLTRGGFTGRSQHLEQSYSVTFRENENACAT